MSIFIKTLEMQSRTILFRPRDFASSHVLSIFSLDRTPPPPTSPSRTVTKPGYRPNDLTKTLASTKKKWMNKNVFI